MLGGGYIAAELAHVFAAAGAEIVVIEQADTLLGGQDETVTEEFTALRTDLAAAAKKRGDAAAAKRISAARRPTRPASPSTPRPRRSGTSTASP